MVKKEAYVCDQCGKASHLFEEGSQLPFNHGWRFLESFSFKATQAFKHETIRKQFCSSECLLQYVQSFTHSQEELANNNGRQ